MSVKILVSVVVAVVVIVVVKQFLAAPAGPALSETQWRAFPLVNKTVVNHNTAIYRFKLPRPDSVLGLPTGQHVSIAASTSPNSVVRSYTPISSDSLKGFVDMLVKTYPNGQISSHFAKLNIGDVMYFRGPKGNFNYKPNTISHLCMVAGGSGLTPMFQILQAIVENPEDKTRATFIFANVDELDILMRAELDTFMRAKPGQITIHYVLNNPPEEWVGSVGFVTTQILEAQLPKPTKDAKLLICGPFPMVNAVKKAAVEVGWDKPKLPSKMDHHVFVF